MPTVAEVRTLLAATSVPGDVVDDLIDGSAGMWLLNEPAEILAADLAHCHPMPTEDEVRVACRALDDGRWRLTVVGTDRPGLLARTAAVLARSRLSVRTAGVTTWPNRAFALQGLTVEDPAGRSWTTADWEQLGEDIKSSWRRTGDVAVDWKPEGPVKVMSSPVVTGGSLVTVEAPDRIGLLWAIASWFFRRGLNVQAAFLEEQDQRAVDTFLIDNGAEIDRDGLANHLAAGGGSRRRWSKGFLRRRRHSSTST
jgi:predicted amino acid-binding ACT domain protein